MSTWDSSAQWELCMVYRLVLRAAVPYLSYIVSRAAFATSFEREQRVVAHVAAAVALLLLVCPPAPPSDI